MSAPLSVSTSFIELLAADSPLNERPSSPTLQHLDGMLSLAADRVGQPRPTPLLAPSLAIAFATGGRTVRTFVPQAA